MITSHFGIDHSGSIANFVQSDRPYLIDLLQKYKIIRFKDQQVESHQLVQFSEILGPVWTNDDNGILSGNRESKYHHPNTNKITLVSNKHGVLSDKLVPWHCDVSHKPWQTKGGTMPFRVLYCVKTASDEKSVTRWFDQCYVYDNISPDLRSKVETLQVCLKAPYETRWEQNVVPLVLVDPVDGKKSISVQQVFFNGFVGLAAAESKHINDQLLEVALRTENILTNVWSVGDIIITNNYNTTHQRDPMFSKEERTLWRTTLQIPELVPDSIKPDDF